MKGEKERERKKISNTHVLSYLPQPQAAGERALSVRTYIQSPITEIELKHVRVYYYFSPHKTTEIGSGVILVVQRYQICSLFSWLFPHGHKMAAAALVITI